LFDIVPRFAQYVMEWTVKAPHGFLTAVLWAPSPLRLVSVSCLGNWPRRQRPEKKSKVRNKYCKSYTTNTELKK
uniref:Uncharacterized protein n=1 Tax=Felis catus TaxID=9685 RepID=A0ABI7X657_FELCA